MKLLSTTIDHTTDEIKTTHSVEREEIIQLIYDTALNSVDLLTLLKDDNLDFSLGNFLIKFQDQAIENLSVLIGDVHGILKWWINETECANTDVLTEEECSITLDGKIYFVGSPTDLYDVILYSHTIPVEKEQIDNSKEYHY